MHSGVLKKYLPEGAEGILGGVAMKASPHLISK